MNAIGRNEPCPCGSGKKYKKCCLERDEALARQNRLCPPREDDFTAELLPKVDEAVDRLLIRVEKGQFENVEAGLEALLREHPDYHTTNYAMGVYLAMFQEDPRAPSRFSRRRSACSRLWPRRTSISARAISRPVGFQKRLPPCARRFGILPTMITSSGKAREELQTLERIVREQLRFKLWMLTSRTKELFDLAFETPPGTALRGSR